MIFIMELDIELRKFYGCLRDPRYMWIRFSKKFYHGIIYFKNTVFTLYFYIDTEFPYVNLLNLIRFGFIGPS